MKWLIVFPDDGETNAAIAEGCRTHDIEYDTIDARRFPHTFYETMCKNKGRYDAVLMSRTLEIYPGFIQSKHKFPKPKYMIWNPDTRDKLEMWGPLMQFFREVDYYFFMDKTTLPEMKTFNPNTFYLPQGIHEERYHKVQVSLDDHKKYDCDVSFIGSIIPEIHKERFEVMKAFEEAEGIDFKMFQGIYGDEHNKAVMCSQINLSCEHSPDRAGYFSVRNYKVIACGGITLDLYHEDLDILFGDSCYYFRTPKEAVDKAREILMNYAEYKKKAERFRFVAMKRHTYAERIGRVKALLETGKFEDY